jgi:hypothetical protein
MEKVIREFRVIETDDGYRIEIKGDKERMKHFFRGFRRGRGRGRGPFRIFGMPGFGFGLGPGPGFWAGFTPWEVDFVTRMEDEDDEERDQEEPEAA